MLASKCQCTAAELRPAETLVLVGGGQATTRASRRDKCASHLPACWQLLTRWPRTQASQAYFSPSINMVVLFARCGGLCKNVWDAMKEEWRREHRRCAWVLMTVALWPWGPVKPIWSWWDASLGVGAGLRCLRKWKAGRGLVRLHRPGDAAARARADQGLSSSIFLVSGGTLLGPTALPVSSRKRPDDATADFSVDDPPQAKLAGSVHVLVHK